MKIRYLAMFFAFVPLFSDVAFALTKTVTTQGYVDTTAATKQDKITGTENYAVTYGTTAGTTSERQIIDSLTGAETSDTELPTAGAVVTALNGKQGVMNGNANTVVTYTGSSGGVGSRGIYQASGTLANQNNSLAEAGHVNTAVTNAFNAHLTCHQYDNSGTQTAEHCLTWNVNNLSAVYVPQNQ